MVIMSNFLNDNPSSLDFFDVVALEEIPAGERLFIEVGDKSIVLINLAGKIFAIGDVCSHDNGPVGDGDIEDHEIICPRHGARFDVRTGKATSLPAIVDIPAYSVRIINGMVKVGIPKK
jgi:3-phenylpropionate/trans-cinnamate dioxygenase ferredoxin subunit